MQLNKKCDVTKLADSLEFFYKRVQTCNLAKELTENEQNLLLVAAATLRELIKD